MSSGEEWLTAGDMYIERPCRGVEMGEDVGVEDRGDTGNGEVEGEETPEFPMER